MKQLIGFVGAIVVTFFLAAQLTAAAAPGEDLAHTGRVVISTEGDVTIEAGQHADLVVVVNGKASINGEVNTVVAVDGAVDLAGARVETVVAVRSPVEVGPGTVVLGDVLTLDSLVHRTGDSEVAGDVRDLASALIGVGAVLAPALLLVWLGFGLAVLAAGLLLAGLAARQVRSAEALISHQPVQTFAVGLFSLILVPLAALALIATIIGAPLGVGILIQLFPLVAFIGYLVAGIWIGDRVLGRAIRSDVERPYGAALVGLVLLQALSLIPVLGILSAIASLVGFGAVVRLGWRNLRSHVGPIGSATNQAPAPAGA